jgi:hypothetical protein
MISCLVLLRMKCFKVVDKIKPTFYVPYIYIFFNCAFYEIMQKKSGTARQTTDDNIMWYRKDVIFMLDN